MHLNAAACCNRSRSALSCCPPPRWPDVQTAEVGRARPFSARAAETGTANTLEAGEAGDRAAAPDLVKAATGIDSDGAWRLKRRCSSGPAAWVRRLWAACMVVPVESAFVEEVSARQGNDAIV
jgi:hypothetical protein